MKTALTVPSLPHYDRFAYAFDVATTVGYYSPVSLPARRFTAKPAFPLPLPEDDTLHLHYPPLFNALPTQYAYRCGWLVPGSATTYGAVYGILPCLRATTGVRITTTCGRRRSPLPLFCSLPFAFFHPKSCAVQQDAGCRAGAFSATYPTTLLPPLLVRCIPHYGSLVPIHDVPIPILPVPTPHNFMQHSFYMVAFLATLPYNLPCLLLPLPLPTLC